jgi:hypothetical protein
MAIDTIFTFLMLRYRTLTSNETTTKNFRDDYKKKNLGRSLQTFKWDTINFFADLGNNRTRISFQVDDVDSLVNVLLYASKIIFLRIGMLNNMLRYWYPNPSLPDILCLGLYCTCYNNSSNMIGETNTLLSYWSTVRQKLIPPR